MAIDPHSVPGLQTAIFASLNGMGHVDEAKRTLATYPPGARLADFAILGSAPPAVYLKMIERDFAAALNLSDAEIADPTENRAAIRVLASNSDAARDEIAGG